MRKEAILSAKRYEINNIIINVIGGTMVECEDVHRGDRE